MRRDDDWARLGDLLRTPDHIPTSPGRRIAEVWEASVGPEVARHARPRSFRDGRLIVATSSSVWAQTLQLMKDEVLRMLNAALEGGVVREVLFRPAGWDPGGGVGSPRALQVAWGEAGPLPAGEDVARARADREGNLTEDEVRAVEAVRELACDPGLGEAISRAMMAALARRASKASSNGPDS